MEFYEELLLTALITVLLAFLLGRIAADRPEAAPLAADLGPRRRVVLDPIQEEEETEKPEAKSSDGDSSVLGESGTAETAFVVEERSHEQILERGKEVGGFDLEKSSSEVGAKQKVVIGKSEDDLVKREGRLVGDKEDVEKVAELGGVDVVADGENGGSLLQGEDEWEGIERSELEKSFGVAAEFVGSKKGGEAVSKLSNEVQMQLYGLHKVATEGPCREPQPMALMVSARAKWHAWQRLGNMNPESAMDEYISLLTESIPGWMAEKFGEKAKVHDGNDHLVAEVPKIGHLDSKSSHFESETEILVEDSSSVEGVTDDVDTGPKLFKQVLTKMFLFNLLSPTRVTF